MANTNHLSMTLVEQSQAQKEVTVNQAIVTLDAILNTGAKDKDLATPPGSPSAGDVYIVAASATGAWSGKDNKLAHYTNGAWAFITPNEGMTIWVNDENLHYAWDGSAWGTVIPTTFDNLAHLGINATADATNKLAVNSGAVLFNHNGSNCQIKVNKNTATDTASYLFQTNFSGRAEFGTVGNDDFQLKVSSDGSTFNQAIVVDKSTGDVRIKKQGYFDGDAIIDVVGKGLKVKEGSNARMGTATLSSGAVTVNNTSITANTRIFISKEGTIAGNIRVSARVVGTSFTITSSAGTDNGTIFWFLVEPA